RIRRAAAGPPDRRSSRGVGGASRMADIRFYHLTRSPLDRALHGLLKRIRGRGMRAVVRVGTPQQAEDLTESLYRQSPDDFLPAATAQDGRPEEQPIWLSADADDYANDPGVLVLTLGAACAEIPESIGIVCLVFDGADDTAVRAAREQWKIYRDA